MESLRVRVLSVEVMPEARLAVARVSAASAIRVRGRPAARIDLEVRFDVTEGASLSATRRHARDRALAYLDPLRAELTSLLLRHDTI